MLGKHCLWPFAFHCTGMPIQAAADTLKRELLDSDQCASASALEALSVDSAAGEDNGPDPTTAGDPAGARRFKSGKSKAACKRGAETAWVGGRRSA